MKRILYLSSFINKGFEVSLLLMLPFIQLQQHILVYHIGLLSAAMSLSQITSNFFAGHISEKIGTKRVIIFSLVAIGAAWIFVSLPTHLAILFIVYLLGGISVGIFSPVANAAIAKLSDTNRAKAMGDFSAFTDLGRVALSGVTTYLLGIFGYQQLAIIYAGVTVLLLLSFLRIRLTNSRPEQSPEPTKIIPLLLDNKYRYAVFTGMCDGFASSSLYIFIPLLLIPKGITFAATGLLTSLFFLGYLSGRLLLGRLADKHGAATILIVAEILMALTIILLIFLTNVVVIACVIYLLGVFTRGTSPVIRAMVADTVTEKHKFAKAYSFYSFSVNSASVLSRPIYGYLAAILGIQSVFYVASGVALLALLPILGYKSNDYS